MDDSIELRPLVPHDFDAVIAVALSLPDWFNDLGIEQMTVDLHHQRGAVAEVDGDVVGFVTWFSRDGLGEIGWIAVGSGHHRYGSGTRLLEFAEDSLRSSGVTLVQVDTLGESVDYEPYERTRSFYRGTGFRDFKSVMTDNPGMPETLTLRKSLLQSPGDSRSADRYA